MIALCVMEGFRVEADDFKEVPTIKRGACFFAVGEIAKAWKFRH
jgi:hypothetical protein